MVKMSRVTVAWIAVVAGIVVTLPLQHVYIVSAPIWGGIFAAMGIISGASVIPYFKSESHQFVDLPMNLRRSQSEPGELASTSSDARVAGAAVYGLSGANFPPFNSSNKSLAVVQATSCEEVPDADLTLCYSWLSSLEEPKQARAVMAGFVVDLARGVPNLSFKPERKGRSEAWWGPFFDSRIHIATQVESHRQERLIKKYGISIAEKLPKLMAGEQQIVDTIARISKSTQKQGLLERAKVGILGKPKTEAQEQKSESAPGDDEP